MPKSFFELEGLDKQISQVPAMRSPGLLLQGGYIAGQFAWPGKINGPVGLATGSYESGNLSALPQGDTARLILDQIQTSHRDRQRSFSVPMERKGAFNELCLVADECRDANWDAQGAAPVTDETYRLAYRFLESLPLGISAPSVGAEPDGHLTLEWHRSARRTLSVSVSPGGDLHYAALLGQSKAYGTEPFVGQPPKTILDIISRVMSA